MRPLLLTFCAAAAPSVQAEPVGDVKRGYNFAKQVCAECHAIEKNDLYSPNISAPNFSVIAQSPGMSGIALSVFLRTPHVDMPNLILSAQEILDVTAYIESLKP